MSILVELQDVIEQTLNGPLREKYANALCEEAIKLIRKDDLLPVSPQIKQFLLRSVSNRDYKALQVILPGVVSRSDDYLSVIEASIAQLLSLEVEDWYTSCKRMNSLVTKYWIGIRDKGYTKQYLVNLVTAWSSRSSDSFGVFWDRVKSLATRGNESFSIYFQSNLGYFTSGAVAHVHKIGYPTKYGEDRNYNKNYFNWLEGVRRSVYRVEVQALDYYSAARLAKATFFECIDRNQFSTTKQLYVGKSCFVVGQNDPSKAQKQATHYYVDDHLRYNHDTADRMTKMLADLDLSVLSSTAKNKVTTSLRFLRSGYQSDNVATMLLNYWIGMEHIFASQVSSEGIFERLKEHYSKMQALVLFKRTLLDLHKSVIQFKLQNTVTNFDPRDIEYLMDSSNLKDVIANFHSHVTLSFRAKGLVDLVQNPDKIRSMMINSQQMVKLNLIRIYRYRNEIVHSAKYGFGSTDICAHLRYYFLFTVTSIIKYFIDNPEDVNRDGIMTLDDFFTERQVKFALVTQKGAVDLDYLKTFMYPMELMEA
jgi:hypothetical protein